MYKPDCFFSNGQCKIIWRRWPFIFLLAVLLSFSQARASDLPKFKALLQLPVHDTGTIRLETVVQVCDQLIEAKDSKADQLKIAYERRAWARTQLGQLGAAMEDCNKLQELGPNDPQARYLHASILYVQGKSEDCLSELREIMKKNPEFAKAFSLASMIQANTGNFEESLDFANQAIKLDSDDLTSFSARALAYYDHADVKCLEDVNRVIEALPDCDDQLYAMRGKAYLWLQEPDKALANFLMARRINPGSLNGYWGIWRVYFDKQNWELSQIVADQFVRVAPNYAGAYLCCARSHAELGNLQEADRAVQEGLKRAPNDPEVLWGAALVNERLGKFEDAIGYYDKAISLKTTIGFKVEKALFLASCPDPKFRNGAEAKTIASEALSSDRYPQWQRWKAFMALAMANAECGEFKEAADAAKKSLENLGPHSLFRAGFQKRLELFEMGLPYRLEVVKGTMNDAKYKP
jgi:tetratricopeptide (TPR) repeat protein